MATYKGRDAKKYWDNDWKRKWNDVWWPASDFAEKTYPTMQKENLKKILDIGSGNGRDSLYFAGKGLNVTAVDISESAISMLKKENKKNIKCFCRDVGNIEFPDNSFDVVYGHLILHYFTDKELKIIMSKIYRMLKSSGYLFVKCKSTKDPLFGKGEKIEENTYFDGHLRHFFTEEYMQEILKDFRILEINEISLKKQTIGHKYKAAFIEASVRKE